MPGWNLQPKLKSATQAAVYAGFLLFLLFTSYHEGLSNYYSALAFDSGSADDVAKTIAYSPTSTVAHRTAAEVAMRNKDYPLAAAEFERAAELSKQDYVLWLGIGYARQQMGEFGNAETAYNRAIELAPNYSRPRYYRGMLMLDADRDEEAFADLSKAAELDHALEPAIQRLARKTFNDANAIEAAMRPASPEAKRSVARYLIKYHYMTDSVREYLMSGELSPVQKNEFVRYLLHKQEFQLARDVWRSRQGQDVVQTGLPIFDSGFEMISESDPSGLGWQIYQKMSAIAVARDRDNVHSGVNAINVRFAGNVEIARPILSQYVYVEPGRKHTLSFFVMVGDIVSAGLPAIVVSNGETGESLGISEPLSGTGGKWEQRSITFTAPDLSVVLFSLQRPSCAASPCPIFGDLSLDDISITERPDLR